MENKSKQDQNFYSHLKELRKRAFISLSFIVLFAIIIYAFSPDIIKLIDKQFKSYFLDTDLIGKSPIDAFLVRLKISAFLGFLLSLPIILFEIWEFIKPGLMKKEKKYFFLFLTIGSFLGIGGALFCHFLIVPIALKFFYSQYKLLSLKPIIHFNDYITLIIKFDATFALIFELPIILVILAKLDLVDSTFLKKYSRHAILVIFTLAAILTPPDVITQLLMAIPLVVLYFLSIYLVKILVK
ncbi:MAG: twin-arginine translocase subunit TatC [Bdellovibrionota bacterium]